MQDHFLQISDFIDLTHQGACAVKTMLFGMVLMVNAAALGAMEPTVQQLSQFHLILTCLICGSAGMMINIAFFFKVISGQEVAQHAVGSVLLAAVFGPMVTTTVASWLSAELNLNLAMATAGGVGLIGGPLVKKFGPMLIDKLGNWGISKIPKQDE